MAAASHIVTNETYCSYILSHGQYHPSKEKITVPNNINLIQYSTPKMPLTVFEAKYLYEQQCNIVSDKIFLVNKTTGEIFKTTYKVNITGPGQKTTNLLLTFTRDEFRNFNLGIYYPDNTFEFALFVYL